jgi:methionyl-tRNA formyltransferase
VTSTDVATLEPERLRRARVVAFATAVLVPPQVIDQLGYGAYNFHSGPPNYPGWAPSYFAIYHQVTEFGATAHQMVKRIDAGPIVGFETFRVPMDTTAAGLEALANGHLARLFWQLAKLLATQSEPLVELPMQWSGQKTSRRKFAAMCDIPLNVSKEELIRRIKAFGGNPFGITPAINLHGIRFQFTPEDSSQLSASNKIKSEFFHANFDNQKLAASHTQESELTTASV